MSSGHTTQTTGAAFDTTSAEQGSSSAGLVLLYAAAYASMPAAFPFAKAEVVIGREDSADVTVPDSAVSRRHASIVFDGAGWSLVDHGSSNGTWLDGRRIDRARLLERARVRIGDALFTFVAREADAYVPYGLDGFVRGVPGDDVDELLGGKKVRQLAATIARVGPTQLSCLIYGETGTGKELVAQALHRLSSRKGALQAINCAAVPAQLFESELFGYKRGAFSGADRDKPGLVHGAHEGTLFLDEIAELPLELQAKLLRVLQSREVLPIGALRPETVDVRVVAATHQDLSARVLSGHFRGDLLARLDEHAFFLPALRDRKEDLLMLASAFARRYASRPVRVGFDVMDALIAYDWPFNVRELEASIKRAVALADGEVLTRRDLPPQVLAARAAPDLVSPPIAGRSSLTAGDAGGEDAGFHRGAPTEPLLRRALEEHAGNIAAVSRALGKRRMQVQRYMLKYGIAPAEYRKVDAGPDDQD